jgi:predicted transcriptional regulator
MEDILFEIPKAFVPEPTHIQILQVVADNPSCHISHVVHQLLPDHSESSVRSGIRILLSKRHLDAGRSNNEIRLRLTSSGRLALQRATI